MKKILILITLILASSCGTTQLVEEWKSPSIDTFNPQKILVIGLTADESIRRVYESTIVEYLEKEKVVAVRSVDFFGTKFRANPMQQSDLDTVEQELLEKNFDVVLITQLMGKEERATYLKSHRPPLLHSNFKELYLHHQDLFKVEERTTYTVYHTHTSYYCLCPEKDRELIWSAGIDLTGPGEMNATMHSYARKLTNALREQQLLGTN